MQIIEDKQNIPISIKEFIDTIPKNLYENLNKIFDVSVEVINISQKDVVALIIKKDTIDPLFYNMTELYLKYVDQYECSIKDLITELANNIKWYASELERDDDLIIES